MLLLRHDLTEQRTLCSKFSASAEACHEHRDGHRACVFNESAHTLPCRREWGLSTLHELRCGRLEVHLPDTCSVLHVRPSWYTARCDSSRSAIDNLAQNAINASWRVSHLRPFLSFRPARFELERAWLVDFLGVRYPLPLYCNRKYQTQVDAHAIRTRQCRLWSQMTSVAPAHRRVVVQAVWPVASEEYIEYADVLAAVDEYVRSSLSMRSRRSSLSLRSRRRARPFVLVEIGCGYGHWALAASAALRQRVGAADVSELYVLSDIVPTLNATVHELAAANGVGASSVQFHAALVVSERAEGRRVNAAALAREAGPWESNWQGVGSWWRQQAGGGPASAVTSADQIGRGAVSSAVSSLRSTREQPGAMMPGTHEPPGGVHGVLTLTLEEMLAHSRTPPCIDMVDIDIQGGEYRGEFGMSSLFGSNHTAATLARRARRLHIGLHGTATEDRRLLESLRAFGFEEQWYFPGDAARGRTSASSTPWGPVRFSDGVLSMINPNWPASCGVDVA